MKFDSALMASDLHELAARKTKTFSWDCSSYTGKSRPDIMGLVNHREVLKVILKRAPSGVPSHPDLRDTLRILHGMYDIFPGFKESQLFKEFTRAADAWRGIAKHCYDLAKDIADDQKELTLEVLDENVQELVKMIELPRPLTRCTSSQDLTHEADDSGGLATPIA